MREMKNVNKILVRKPERKRTLGRPRCRWEDNISVTFKEIACEDMDWVHHAQDRVQWWDFVNALMNHKRQGIFLTSCEIVSYS
jgi:hypothetical protein